MARPVGRTALVLGQETCGSWLRKPAAPLRGKPEAGSSGLVCRTSEPGCLGKRGQRGRPPNPQRGSRWCARPTRLFGSSRRPLKSGTGDSRRARLRVPAPERAQPKRASEAAAAEDWGTPDLPRPANCEEQTARMLRREVRSSGQPQSTRPPDASSLEPARKKSKHAEELAKFGSRRPGLTPRRHNLHSESGRH